MHSNETPVGILFGALGIVALPFTVVSAVKAGKWAWNNRSDLLEKIKEEAGFTKSDEGDNE